MKISILEYPTEADWMKVKERALVTVGKKAIIAPDLEWKQRMLRARHSPVRYLRFSVYFEDLPSYVATHLARHVHAQPYIKSQRNDRQKDYDRCAARQDAPVNMIWDFNAEELMTICNKRLCNCADPVTREVVRKMAEQIIKRCKEFDGQLVPNCKYLGRCPEMFPCMEF